MFQIISRTQSDANGDDVTMILWLETKQYQTIMTADLRSLQARHNEFVPDTPHTGFIDGTVVPVVPARKAKCHNFAGGWNGFSFYTDSKGAMYAVASK